MSLLYLCVTSVIVSINERQCHEMNIFFKGLNILISTFCVCADGFEGLSKSLSLLNRINFLFSSLKLLINFKNAYLNLPQNFLLCYWSMFSSADLTLAARKIRKN
jgi:hypothetical protein